MSNYFSYRINNQFNDKKETTIDIDYCGRKIGDAWMYFDGKVHVTFTDNEPMIDPTEWRYLGMLLDKLVSVFKQLPTKQSI